MESIASIEATKLLSYPGVLVQYLATKSIEFSDLTSWINYTSTKMAEFASNCWNQSDDKSIHMKTTSQLVVSSETNKSDQESESSTMMSFNYFTVSAIGVNVALLVSLLWFIHDRFFFPKRLKNSRRNFHSIFATTLEHIICYSAVTPLAPFIIGLLLIMLVLRCFVRIYLKIFYSGKRFVTNAEDAFWFVEKYASSSASIGLYIIKGECNIPLITSRMKRTVFSDLVGNKLRLRLIECFNVACWELVEDFCLEEHIIVKNVSKKNPMTEVELFDLMQKFQDEPLDCQRPPWQMIIVPHYSYKVNGGSHYAVIFRVHHGVMDGISTGNILHSLLADKPFEFSVDPCYPFGKKEINTRKKILDWLIMAAYYFVSAVCLPRTGLRHLFSFDNMSRRNLQPGPPLTGPKYCTWSRPMDVPQLKQLKNKTKTSIFSILLACIGESMERFYHKTGIPKESNTFHSLSPIALLPYKDRRPKNGFSGILIPFPVNSNMTCIERLHECFAAARKNTSSLSIILGTYFYIQLSGMLPICVNRIIAPYFYMKTSLSNIPGPKEPVSIFGGGELVEMGAWLPIKFSIGMGFLTFSYCDKMRACIIIDKSNVNCQEDVDLLKSEFEKSLQDLCTAAGLKGQSIFVAD